MRKLLSAFLLLPLSVHSQEEQQPEIFAPRFSLTTIFARNVINDYNIGCAWRVKENYTLEARIGWMHPNRLITKYYEEWFSNTDYKFHGPSFYLQLNKWNRARILGKDRNWFYGVYGGYRYAYFTDQSMKLGGTTHGIAEELQLSQWRNDILLLGTLGMRVSKISMSEISLGVRFAWTHSNVTDTRLHPYAYDTPEYDAYKSSLLDEVANAKGFSAVFLVRISSRFGWFK